MSCKEGKHIPSIGVCPCVFDQIEQLKRQLEASMSLGACVAKERDELRAKNEVLGVRPTAGAIFWFGVLCFLIGAITANSGGYIP